MGKILREHGLTFAWLIALFSLCISLYFSEIKAMPVCHLCWYQRICIYPLAIILGIASFLEDRKVVRYALPLSLIGAFFAGYQYLEQMIPGFSPIEFCSINGPVCSDIHLKLLGFITFPFLSLTACLMMATLVWIAGRANNNHG